MKGVITKNNAAGIRGFMWNFSEGLTLFRDKLELRILALLAGIALPVGQLSNAILSSFVWMCRIVIDGRILQICTAQTVGRTRVYIDIMFSFSAMLMSLSPTLVKLPLTSGYFLFWGVIIFICAAALWFTQARSKKTR